MTGVSRGEAVARAIAFRGQGVYKLGRGNGNRPSAPTPMDGQGRCDCSHLVHWCLGSVLNRVEGYFNTDGILADAYGLRHGGGQGRADELVFARLRGEPAAGDLVVRPGEFERQDGRLRRTRPGHVGIIVQVHPEFRRGESFGDQGYKHLRVVHCSTFGTRLPPAIRETDARAWRRSGYLVRYLGFALQE